MKFTKALLRVLPILIGAMIIFLFPNRAVGKRLVYAEYFIDTDPGQGKGDSIPTCDGVFDEAEEEFCINDIPVPPLSDGRHTFFLRLQDSENQWGTRQLDFYIVSSSPYVSKTITEAEYFIDTDPGEGNGTSLPVADGTWDESMEYLLAEGIESSPLSLGQHSLFVRVRDSYNVWSVPRKVNFNVIEASPYKILDSAEYFVDTDPGIGSGSPLTATDGAFDESFEEASKNGISTSSLSPGPHTVGVRFKDNWSYWPTFNGWGPERVDTLCVCEKPNLTFPSNGTTGPCDQTFKWSHLDAVVSYQLQIDTTMTFSEPIRNMTALVETCYVTGLPAYVQLWWRVRGNYSCGDGVWSDTFGYTEVKDGTQDNDVPQSYFLSRNYPNPFNPETQIEYGLPKGAEVNLWIYNVLGQRVRTLLEEYQAAGHKTVSWDGTDDDGNKVASGIYFYKIQAGEFTDSKKMILMK